MYLIIDSFGDIISWHDYLEDAEMAWEEQDGKGNECEIFDDENSEYV